MSWWQFSLHCPAEELDRVEALLLDMGALSISLADAGDEPIYEPLPGDQPVWSESIITGTREMSGSDAIRLRKVTMTFSASINPSSIFTSMI